MEEGNVRGGYGSSDKHLGQDAAPDDKMQERKTQQMGAYFDRLEDSIKGLSSIVLIGPGEARGHFEKHLENSSSSWNILESKVSDSMTDNQLVAEAKGYFYGDSDKELQNALNK